MRAIGASHPINGKVMTSAAGPKYHLHQPRSTSDGPRWGLRGGARVGQHQRTLVPGWGTPRAAPAPTRPQVGTSLEGAFPGGDIARAGSALPAIIRVKTSANTPRKVLKTSFEGERPRCASNWRLASHQREGYDIRGRAKVPPTSTPIYLRWPQVGTTCRASYWSRGWGPPRAAPTSKRPHLGTWQRCPG